MTRIGNKAPKRPKHVPLRTCISCRETKSKRELLRVVRTPDEHIILDPTGKKSGRGAYLCARYTCWQKALKPKKPGAQSLLETEFELALSSEDRTALDDYIATLPKDEPLAPTSSTTRASGNNKKVREKA